MGKIVLNELGERVKYLYVVTLRGTDKRYYGIAFDPKQRWRRHRSNARHKRNNDHFTSALVKYGPEAFDWEIICAWPTEALAKCSEKVMTDIPGLAHYNSVSGGGGTPEPSSETRAKMSKAQRNRGPRKPHTEEAKALISAAHKGKKRGPLPEEQRIKIGLGNRGKKQSEETKQKISKANKGKRPSENTLAAAAAANRGKPLSDNTKNKISKALKGRKQAPEHTAKVVKALTGYKHSNDFKQKCRARQLGKIPGEETRKRLSAARLGKPRPDVSKRQKEVWAERKLNKARKEFIGLLSAKSMPSDLSKDE